METRWAGPLLSRIGRSSCGLFPLFGGLLGLIYAHIFHGLCIFQTADRLLTQAGRQAGRQEGTQVQKIQHELIGELDSSQLAGNRSEHCNHQRGKWDDSPIDSLSAQHVRREMFPHL